MRRFGGAIVATRGSSWRTPLTTSSVEAFPLFRTLTRTPRRRLSGAPRGPAPGFVADARKIAQINGGARRLLDRQVRDLIDRARRAVGADVVLALPDLDRARRRHDILQGDRVQNIARRDALRLHRVLIHVDGDLPLFAAVWRRHHRSRNRDQLRAHRVGGDVVQLLLREVFSRQTDLQNRDGRGAEVDDLRQRIPGRRSSRKRAQ